MKKFRELSLKLIFQFVWDAISGNVDRNYETVMTCVSIILNS